jgi:plastocyanin
VKSLAAVVFVALLAAAAQAVSADDGRVRQVAIPGKAFAPAVLQMLVGDTVVWQNGDASNHTVTADDGAFDSGYLSPGTTFSLVFPRVGHYDYHCTIHKYMKGEVVVVPVSLLGPGQPVVSGGRVVLRGLAPSRVSSVTVSRTGARARTAPPAADGSFTVKATVIRPTVFVAHVKKLASTPVQIFVAPRVRAHRSGGMVVARATPPRPGARSALQSYDREHFTWHTISRSRLDARSAVSFRLPAGHLGRFRIVVRGGHAGWADGASNAVVRHG